MTEPKRSLLREYRDILAKAPHIAQGVMVGIGLRTDPAARSALALACEWQEAVLRIVAISGVDTRVIEEAVKGFGLNDLAAVYDRVAQGDDPYRTIGAVRARWEVER